VERTIYTEAQEEFRGRVRSFFAEKVAPSYAEWERTGRPPREFWLGAGSIGILGIGVPEVFGGLVGSDFRHSAVVTEEAQRVGLVLGGVRVQTDICMPYFLEYANEAQQQRWLPKLVTGEAVSALAMTEPGAGSDVKAMGTRAVRDGDHYVVNGAKTFITNGLSADLVIVAAKTDPAAGRRGISLLVVDADTPGFERGRKLQKIGLRTQDLSELAFTDMLVPVENLLGEEGRGFEYLTSNLAQERLSISLNSQAAAVAVLDSTVSALAGTPAGASQIAKFEIAGCHAEVVAGQALADASLAAHIAGELTPADAAVTKLFCTELQGRVADRCMRVLGPRAYARGTQAGRAFADARVSRIYGGSSEIMKVITAKAVGL
jgi:acyl-CoA dehydrogenase